MSGKHSEPDRIPSELQTLVEDCCTEALTEQKSQRMTALLRDNREAQSFYLAYLSIHAYLSWEFGAGLSTEAEGSQTAASAGSRLSRSPIRQTRPTDHPKTLAPHPERQEKAMPEDFDPYRKWLGIPAKDQPPHHYRLLNIEPFEEDPDVISNAADARTAQLKQRKSGEHSEAAGRILDEVAEARVCLLNPKKRVAYDKQLRPRLKPDKGRSLPTAAPLSADAGSADYMSAATGIPSFESSSVASHASDRSGRKQKQPIVLLVIGAAAVVAILVGLGIYQLTRSNGRSVVERPGPAQPTSSPAASGPSAKTPNPIPAGADETSSKPDSGESVAALLGLDEPEPLLGDLMGDADGPGELTTTPEPSEMGPSATAQHGLLGEYFADQDLTQKVFTQVDPQIQFELGRDPPHPQVPKDFAARWTGWLVAPEPGDYKLSTFVNDGVRLWLDGELLIERWNDSSGTRDEVDVVLTKEPHAIKIEYYDARNESIMRLNWSRPGVFEEQPVPTEALLVDAGSTAIAALPKPSGPSSPGDPSAHVEPPIAPKPPVGRLAVPDRAARQAIESDVKEIFRAELAKATTPEAKAAMAGTLHEQAQSSSDDPNARFVLLQMACNMAAEGGEIAQAMDMIGQMEQGYKINPLSVQAYVLNKATESMPSGSGGLTAGEQIVDTATALAEKCAAEDNYDAAAGFSDLAIKAARKTKDSSLIQPAMAHDREMKRKKATFASIKKAFDTLAANPDDPEANLTAGRWYAFSRDDWSKGLPLLAKGSDPKLAEVARKEMTAPTDSATMVALGDGWFAQADLEKDAVASAVRSRAKFYYEQALPSLSGLERVKVKKRIETLAEAAEVAAVAAKPADIKTSNRGVVQPGNVALATNGTTVTGVSSGASYLLDGSTETGFAYSKHPCQWTITFDKVYQLKAVGFMLRPTYPPSYSSSSRSPRKCVFSYTAFYSPDGHKYFPLADGRRGASGAQQMKLKNVPVKSIRLVGLNHNINSYFYVSEFQAYCELPR